MEKANDDDHHRSIPEQDQAQQAIVELVRSGFPADQTTSFFVNPPGQHDRYPIGGDEDESPGTQDAPTGALSGAAVGGAVGVAVGLATLPILGPGAAIAGAGGPLLTQVRSWVPWVTSARRPARQ